MGRSRLLRHDPPSLGTPLSTPPSRVVNREAPTVGLEIAWMSVRHVRGQAAGPIFKADVPGGCKLQPAPSKQVIGWHVRAHVRINKSGGRPVRGLLSWGCPLVVGGLIRRGDHGCPDHGEATILIDLSLLYPVPSNPHKTPSARVPHSSLLQIYPSPASRPLRLEWES